MEKVTLKCPNCGKKFEITSAELNKKLAHGYKPVFCNYKCEFRYSEKR